MRGNEANGRIEKQADAPRRLSGDEKRRRRAVRRRRIVHGGGRSRLARGFDADETPGDIPAPARRPIFPAGRAAFLEGRAKRRPHRAARRAGPEPPRSRGGSPPDFKLRAASGSWARRRSEASRRRIAAAVFGAAGADAGGRKAPRRRRRDARASARPSSSRGGPQPGRRSARATTPAGPAFGRRLVPLGERILDIGAEIASAAKGCGQAAASPTPRKERRRQFAPHIPRLCVTGSAPSPIRMNRSLHRARRCKSPWPTPGRIRPGGLARRVDRGEIVGPAPAAALGQDAQPPPDLRPQMRRERLSPASRKSGGARLDRRRRDARHPRRRRSRRGGKRKHMQEAQAAILDQAPAARAAIASSSVGKPAIRSAPKAISGRRRRKFGAEGDAVGAAVAALHPLQDQVVARLQRQMQIGREPFLLGEGREQIGVGLDAIDRGQAKARQVRQFAQQPPHQPAELRRARRDRAPQEVRSTPVSTISLWPVSTNLRACARTSSGGDRARGAAPGGNDAEGAAMVAAVLHGEKSAGMALDGREHGRRRIVAPPRLGDRADIVRARKNGPAGARVFSALPMTWATSRHGGENVCGSICAAQPVTTMRASRLFALDPADRLPRLPRRLGGHRAGVDDHEIFSPALPGKSRGSTANSTRFSRQPKVTTSTSGLSARRHGTGPGAKIAASSIRENSSSTGPVMST